MAKYVQHMIFSLFRYVSCDMCESQITFPLVSDHVHTGVWHYSCFALYFHRPVSLSTHACTLFTWSSLFSWYLVSFSCTLMLSCCHTDSIFQSASCFKLILAFCLCYIYTRWKFQTICAILCICSHLLYTGLCVHIGSPEHRNETRLISISSKYLTLSNPPLSAPPPPNPCFQPYYSTLHVPCSDF